MSSTKSVCVYCGSSPGAQPIYVEAATALGQGIAERGWGLVYGGARVGLMGTVADAALGGGSDVHGVIPFGLAELEVGHTGLTNLDVVDTLHERKARMDELSDAFISLPGGHGTLEELFEALTWLQLGIHRKPVAVVNLEGYYDHLIAHLDRSSAEGFIRPEHRDLLLVGDDVETTLDLVERWTATHAAPWKTRP